MTRSAQEPLPPEAEQRLADWLSVATRGLWDPAVLLITRESREHLEQALAAGQTSGQALRELGDPWQAARAYRRHHLMAWQAPLITPLLQGPEPQDFATELASSSWWFKVRVVLSMVGVPVFITWVAMSSTYVMDQVFPSSGADRMAAAFHAFHAGTPREQLLQLAQTYLAALHDPVILRALAVSEGLGLFALVALVLLLRFWVRRAPLRLQSSQASKVTGACLAPTLMLPLIISSFIEERSGWSSAAHPGVPYLWYAVGVTLMMFLLLLYAAWFETLYRRSGAFVG